MGQENLIDFLILLLIILQWFE